MKVTKYLITTDYELTKNERVTHDTHL